MSRSPLIIATRGSRLALYQTHRVKEDLEKKFPEIEVEIRPIKTKGDKILDVALSKIGDKGLFTKELEYMLLNKEAHMAVHSLKDMPTALPDGLMIGGVLERGEVRDALVSIRGKKLAELDETDIVATSSLRRKAQLLQFNAGLKIAEIRGNVETRLQKMNTGYCTAMVMASAGLQRLGYGGQISEILDPEVMLPAAGQGAIAIEIREDDPGSAALLDKINHIPTMIAVSAERLFLGTLEGGCQIPIGCYSEIKENTYRITGFVSDLQGHEKLRDYLEGPVSEAKEIARALADRFLERGARKIIEKIRSENQS
jgi:hydroxymethylbilane synthase